MRWGAGSLSNDASHRASPPVTWYRHIVAAALWLALNRNQVDSALIENAGREAASGNVAAIRYGLFALGLLAAIALLPSLARRLRGEDTPRWIAAHELAGSLDKAGNIAVVDVRGPDEFAGALGHIREARNLPVGELPQRLHELGLLRNKRVVLVCHTDKRSAKAAAILSEAGFQDVLVLRGGMVHWNEAGLPVAHGLGEHRA